MMAELVNNIQLAPEIIGDVQQSDSVSNASSFINAPFANRSRLRALTT